MTPQQKSWKARLEAICLSQSQFARITGIYKPAMCDYLNCRRQPIAETFVKIEEKLKELENANLNR